jgi:HD-like signal output (HDOD) protein
MTSGIDTIDSEGMGSESSERFSEAAIADAQALAASDASQTRWTKPFIRAIRRKRLRLPSLSPTVDRIIKLIESADVDLDELALAVNGDPVLATRIMGVANSTYFRGPTDVPNVREALMRMGVREARTIVVVVALRSTVLRSPGLGDQARELWKHSLLAACATQEITTEVPPFETSGFLAGLLHDLGKLVVLAFVSELPAWQEDGAVPSRASIDAINSAMHASLGAMVLASWGFPEPFCDAIIDYQNSEQVSGESAGLCAAVELGHRMAERIEEGWPDEPEELDEALLAVAARLGLDHARLFDIASEAEANVEALSKLS